MEWEKYADKKSIASEILNASKFTPIPGELTCASRYKPVNVLPEFQFNFPLPTTNPILIGYRWKEYHEVLGLKKIVDFSWDVVQKEKHDLIHVLDFPYNGETRREQLLLDKLTPNKYHL